MSEKGDNSAITFSSVSDLRSAKRTRSSKKPLSSLRRMVGRDERNTGSSGSAETNSSVRSSIQRKTRVEKQLERDRRLLGSEVWITERGHLLTFIGLLAFSFILYFRPYELFEALKSFTGIALYSAYLTIGVFLITQIHLEHRLTAVTTEVKCVIALTTLALIMMPLGIDPQTSWTTFNDTMLKVCLIFLVMVNALRSKNRMIGLMWISIGIGVMLAYEAVKLYNAGVFRTEGYRVSVKLNGMFTNPNDMSLQILMFVPLCITLALGSRRILPKLIYLPCAAVMVIAILLTQSRGAFLGMVVMSAVLVWKLGRRQRLKVMLVSGFFGLSLLALAPGNYGVRLLSIVSPSLDPVGSASDRRDSLDRSILVTLRNPLGIGMGNSPSVGIRNLQTHNAYTQVSSELGWIGLCIYLVMLISPLRKLGAMERETFDNEKFRWIYLTSIGLQACFAGYLVSSFFGSVAYQWFIYYPLAHAVALRRLYQLELADGGIPEAERT